ncbi:hypothetical protein JMUB6875_32700 [Nocardia sp. JMUB6875]|uniref:phage holin family protein n=1 Tax=Nocardia sp. JMUB6875 TaxID=3158170 RepID=UPI0032E642C7
MAETPGKFDPTAITGFAAGDQLNTVIRQQIETAMRETLGRTPKFSKRMKMSAGAALLGLYGGAGLVATVILLLALAIPAWSAALIVAVVLLVAAAVVRSMAKSRSGEPPVAAVDPLG